LLNGMAHMARLDERFGAEKVLGGTSYISSERRADGVIHHLNELETINFGDRFEPDSTRIQAVAAALGGANFTARLSTSILQDMWNKWASLATLAGMTCLMRASISDIAAVGGAPLSIKLYEECAAIAAAEGFGPSEKTIADRRVFFTTSNMTASMLRDLESGGRIEADHILGDLLERGRKHAVATPMLQTAYTHVRCYEERRKREQGVPVGE
jgi:2-dehydropantoate 2-reductase